MVLCNREDRRYLLLTTGVIWVGRYTWNQSVNESTIIKKNMAAEVLQVTYRIATALEMIAASLGICPHTTTLWIDQGWKSKETIPHPPPRINETPKEEWWEKRWGASTSIFLYFRSLSLPFKHLELPVFLATAHSSSFQMENANTTMAIRQLPKANFYS